MLVWCVRCWFLIKRPMDLLWDGELNESPKLIPEMTFAHMFFIQYETRLVLKPTNVAKLKIFKLLSAPKIPTNSFWMWCVSRSISDENFPIDCMTNSNYNQTRSAWIDSIKWWFLRWLFSLRAELQTFVIWRCIKLTGFRLGRDKRRLTQNLLNHNRDIEEILVWLNLARVWCFDVD